MMGRLTALFAIATWLTKAGAENEPIEEPDCDSTKSVSIRYASSSQRLYVEAGVDGESGGCVTLSDIYAVQGTSGPLYPVDPDSGDRVDTETGTWLLTESLYVEDGITLQVHGGTGGADELRLLSDSDTFFNLRAHGGSLSFHDTKVFSWDEGAGSYDTDTDDGRSYISVISEIIVDSSEDCTGAAKNTMGEARMDIVSSEIGYLGYYDSESYGLTWKVRGYCSDESNPEIFDEVNVYGNIYDSEIHDNYFGVYTYGHQQGDWRRNKMYDNIEYGFDPHDDSDYLNIHDNEVWGNGNHGIIASKRCDAVSIVNNEVYDGGNAGLFLHRSSNDATITGNHAYNNDDAGLAVMESFRANVYDNVFEDNKYGIRLSVGATDNIFTNNVISGSSQYNVYTYEGSDEPWVSSTGRPQDNEFIENEITGGDETIKLTEADGTVFQDNVFSDVGTVRFDDTSETLMVGNTGLEDASIKIEGGACFASGSDSDFTPTC